MLGTGIIKGLAVTARNLVGSYHDPERFVTVQYPEEKAPITEAFRNFPFLVYDAERDPMGTLRCVACQICEKECPPQCIYIEKSRDKKPDALGKPQFYPAVFDIDTSVCMSCQICVEVCPFEAIKMDQVFEIATTDRFEGLLWRREQLAKSNEYYHQIHPAEATAGDARLDEEKRVAEERAKAAAAAKAAAPKPAAATPTPSPAAKPQREGGQKPVGPADAAAPRPPPPPA